MSIRLVLVGVAAGAAIVSMVAVGVLLYGDAQRAAGRAECQEAHRVAGLEQFQREAEKLTGLADKLHSAAQALSEAKPKVIERYTRVEVEKPLPADCVLDAGRLQHTNAGIEQANAAGQLAPALPAGTAPGH